MLFSVPLQLIFKGFGGSSKGLPFKDLLCGLVVLTKGTREEKIKCEFCLNVNTYICIVLFLVLLLIWAAALSTSPKKLLSDSDEENDAGECEAVKKA